MSKFYEILDLCATNQLSGSAIQNIKRIISDNKLTFDSEDEARSATVSVVAYYGHVAVLELFMQLGLDIHTDIDALDGAAKGKQVECVKFLLREGADPRSIQHHESYHNSDTIADILDTKCRELVGVTEHQSGELDI
jgi:hypothetical protein